MCYAFPFFMRCLMMISQGDRNVIHSRRPWDAVQHSSIPVQAAYRNWFDFSLNLVIKTKANIIQNLWKAKLSFIAPF